VKSESNPKPDESKEYEQKPQAKIDLRDFEKKIRVRPLKKKDYPAIVELQEACFPRLKPWDPDQFESLVTTFPEGQLCVELNGLIVASSSSLIVDFDLYSEWHDWMHISGGGHIRNHNPQGDTLYGIEIMVHPDFRGMKLARRLYHARKALCKKTNIRRIVIGGRIPGYKKHAAKLSAREYVEKVRDKSIYDPVLTTQLANGFQLQQLIPDYMPTDEDSAGWATHMQWLNPDYIPSAQRRIETVQSVRICTIQYEMRPLKTFADFVQQVECFVDVASDYHCDFVVFPELFTTQLLSFTPAKRPGEAARKLSEFTPKYLELFTRLAVTYNVNIIGGSQFTMEEGKLFNIAYLFRRDGTLGKQYKLHVTPAERKWWGVEGGTHVEVFDTDRGRVAINICYDIEFPELARLAARRGAQILFCPFNTDERHGYLRIRYCAQARCVENHLYVVLSGCVGNLPFVDNADIHYAQSGILTPCDFSFSREGIAAECTPNVETIVVHDVDLELLRRHRYTGTTQNWSDRRRDVYKIVYQEGDQITEV